MFLGVSGLMTVACGILIMGGYVAMFQIAVGGALRDGDPINYERAA